MANTFSWILRARCRDMDCAQEVKDALGKDLPCTLTYPTDIEDRTDDKNCVFVMAYGDGEWNLERSGLLEGLRKLSHVSRLADFEVLASDCTKFSGEGNVISDVCRERLYLGCRNEVMLHDFGRHVYRFGRFIHV